MINAELTNTVVLLRVSSKGQTNKLADSVEDEIPMQRKFVLDKAQKSGLNVIKIFTEGGISGYKVSQDDRDAIQAIKEMARRKEFNILYVYKFDRIGRIADETTSTCKFLYKHGIDIYQAFDDKKLQQGTHIDGLTTYIEFWKNESYSVELSGRVSDARIMYALEGKYSGGGINKVPYGYKLEHIGEVNSKGTKILSYVINEEEKPLIILIFNLCIDHNMGTRRIATYLREKGIKNRNGKDFYYGNINSILHNSMYKGYTHIFSKKENKDYYSKDQIERLIIIPEEQWELAQQMLSERCDIHNGNRAGARGITRGRLLLSGLAYCGYCGSKMIVWTNHKKWHNVNGETKTNVYDTYKCNKRNTFGTGVCEGQNTYKADRIEKMVEKITKQTMAELSNKKLNNEFYSRLDEQLKILLKSKNVINNNLKTIQEELSTLKQEITKSLLGKSEFTPKLLNEIIENQEKELTNQFNLLDKVDKDINDAKLTKANYSQFDIDVKTWCEKYDRADLEDKKVMMSKVIDRVLIYRDKIDISYNIAIKDFVKNSEDTDENTEDIGGQSYMLGRANETFIPPDNIKFNKTIVFEKLDFVC